MGKAGGGTTYSCGSGWPGGDQQDHRSDVVCEGGPIWFVIKMVLSGDEENERTYMWLNPDPTVEPDTSVANVIMNANANDGFDRIALECGGEDVMETHWDEIRLGTSYESVAVTSLPRANQNVPDQFNLSQNYPNPFNPTTTISYQIPNQARNDNVKLKIYDIRGREIKTLVNKFQATGTYEVIFDASELTSGIYYYQLNIFCG